jgi:hypothetical protein
MLSFDAHVYQNEYLPEGAGEVNAVVTVTGRGGSAGPAASAGFGSAALPSADVAEIIIVDCSLSMNYPSSKMHAAKQATAAAIDALRPGVEFAVIAGDHLASVCYPRSGRLARAAPDNKAAAKRAVNRLQASGGTKFSTWLELANRMFETRPGAIRHAILLTDGHNESESAADLGAALARCVGNFACDCRGVGTDWSVDELRRVATSLLGTVDIVARPADLVTDFTRMMTRAMDKAVADVALRIWTPLGARTRFVKQVAPEVRDLTASAVGSGPQTLDYPTGSWGGESRDYHICVTVRPGDLGDEMLAARVGVVVNGAVQAKGLVRAIWTEDQARSTRINQQVAHYTGQAELAEAIQEGLRARKDGDVVTATARLGRAVALATASGHADTAKLLRQVVDIDDPVTGTVRLKPVVADEDEMALDTRSTKTIRSRPA